MKTTHNRDEINNIKNVLKNKLSIEEIKAAIEEHNTEEWTEIAFAAMREIIKDDRKIVELEKPKKESIKSKEPKKESKSARKSKKETVELKENPISPPKKNKQIRNGRDWLSMALRSTIKFMVRGLIVSFLFYGVFSFFSISNEAVPQGGWEAAFSRFVPIALSTIIYFGLFGIFFTRLPDGFSSISRILLLILSFFLGSFPGVLIFLFDTSENASDGAWTFGIIGACFLSFFTWIYQFELTSQKSTDPNKYSK